MLCATVLGIAGLSLAATPAYAQTEIALPLGPVGALEAIEPEPVEPVEPAAPPAESVPVEAGRLVVVREAVPSVVHGEVSTVTARLVGPGGIALSGQPVELHARVVSTTEWRRVASGTTDEFGGVTLRAVLQASSALRLHHPVDFFPADAFAAPDVYLRSVLVATRVSAVASATRIRLGQTLVVRGGVAPSQVLGAPVLLQQWVGTWRTVAAGRMTSATAYALSWRPTSPGLRMLRVVRPSDGQHTQGSRAPWLQRVDPESAADIARAILWNPRIGLAPHISGVRDLATPRHNLVDVANGRPARRSAYDGAPGGVTGIDIRVLGALRRMGAVGSVTVSEIAGGSHARSSTHYAGRGLDISWVNGRPVSRGSGYQLAVDACRGFGAARVFHPAYDPFGGHQGHVHCDW